MVRKRRPAARLRISGVVKAMNLARERLSAGIPAGEAGDFRDWVSGIISAVDQICKRNRLAPEQLSTPTYRAYQYLKSIDLQSLPAHKEEASLSAKPRARVSNLVALCSRLQARMAGLAGQSTAGTGVSGGIEREILELQQLIQDTARQVEEICRQAQATPQALPPPSRRAYQWIRYLSDPKNLSRHMQALQRALEASQDLACRHKLPASRRKIRASLQFYNIPALYRSRVKKDELEIIASEGFIGAPKKTLEDLICSALSGKDTRFLAGLRQYADTIAFSEVLQAVQPIDRSADQPGTRGQFYDLDEIFERVNREYFNGKILKPRLTWNKTVTHRKLGHYQPASDTVMVSITLDRSDIPAYVIDFVMYHELLHKALGISNANGRRYAHTKAFRAAEKQFKFYAEAQEFLDKIGQKIAL